MLSQDHPASRVPITVLRIALLAESERPNEGGADASEGAIVIYTFHTYVQYVRAAETEGR